MQELEKVNEKIVDYIDLIIEPPLKEVGGILADSVKMWRYRNQLRIIEKTKALHEKHKIPIRKIPVKTLASFMEYSSLEENEYLQDMWTNLLFNATTSNNKSYNHHTLINILKELVYEEVVIINYLFAEHSEYDGWLLSRAMENHNIVV